MTTRSSVKIGGAYRQVRASSAKIGGTWRRFRAGWCKQSGVWVPLRTTAFPVTFTMTVGQASTQRGFADAETPTPYGSASSRAVPDGTLRGLFLQEGASYDSLVIFAGGGTGPEPNYIALPLDWLTTLTIAGYGTTMTVGDYAGGFDGYGLAGGRYNVWSWSVPLGTHDWPIGSSVQVTLT